MMAIVLTHRLKLPTIFMWTTILISCIPLASSYTEIGGPLNSDQRLTLDESPYLITTDLVVQHRLSIEPGVRIEISPKVGIIVKAKGQLIASGHENQKIIFTSKNPGTWRGIPQDIRLIEGSSVLNGRLQLLYKNSWRSVCTNSKNWTQSDLDVACKQLGFGSGRFYKWYSKPNNDTKHLLYQSPNCADGSDSLFRCDISSREMGSGVCDDHHDLGIECDPHVDENRQYWSGIKFDYASKTEKLYLDNTLKRSESSSILKNTQILFAGVQRDGQYTSAIQSIGIPPRLVNTEIKWSAFNGVNITVADHGFTIKNCKIIQNRGYGIFINTSQGMAEVASNSMISNNGGDGIRYVFHDSLKSAQDQFCDSSHFSSQQVYPKRMIQLVSRDRQTSQYCEKEFKTKGLPGQVLTVHFLTLRNDPYSKAFLEVIDTSLGSSVSLAKFVLKNNTRPPSVSSFGRAVTIKFTSDPYKETYFALEVTTSIGKAPDLNVTDSNISKNIGSGITVENERSSVVVNRTTISNNSNFGLKISHGSGDIYVNNSFISKNMNDGINITYFGGKRILTKTEFIENQGHAIAVWFNTSAKNSASFQSQHTEVSYSDFSLNLKSAVLIGNYCLSDSFVNVSMNSFRNSIESAILMQSCWEKLENGVKPTSLLISNNKFSKNKKLGLEIAPVFNLAAEIEHNSFTLHENGVIYMKNYYLENFSHLPANITIRKNLFAQNSGSFVCNIGLTEESITQKLVFTRNKLEDNLIKDPFPALAPRSKVAAVIAVSSSNVEVYRNLLKNPESDYELGSHTEGHYLAINATYNYWNSIKAKDIYERIFDVKNRYNLAKVNFIQFLKYEYDLETGDVSQIRGEQGVVQFRNDERIGGEVIGKLELHRGVYEVLKDIYIQPGSKLTIRPGVVLKFRQSVGMMVQGVLDSVGGSLTDQITYTYSDRAPGTMTEKSVKLTGGNEGKVLVKIDDEWGSVCRNGWDIVDAALVCNQLGLALNPNDWILEQVDVYNVSAVGEIKGTFLSNVQCNELDTDITTCKSETTNDFENSCTEEAAIKCYDPSWAGIRFGMMAERSYLESSVVEKAGLFDYSTNNFQPSVKIDFNHHSLKNLKLYDNFDSGLGIIYNDLFYSRDAQRISDSFISSNIKHGAATRTQGFQIDNCKLKENGGSGVHYHPQILNQEHKDLMRWIYLQDNKRIINVTDSRNMDPFHLDEGEKKFFVIRPDGLHDPSKSDIKVYIKTRDVNVLGVQILNPINRLSTEEVVIYDFKEVNEGKVKWDLKKNLTMFPRVSTSFGITITYRPGDLPLGSILLYISSVSRNDFDSTFNPKIVIDRNEIERCGDGISTVHYNRDVSDNGDLYLRNANESILLLNTIVKNNAGPIFYVKTPFNDPLVTNLAAINITLTNVTASGNGGIITQFSRDSRNSNNLFHWKVNESRFEDNEGQGIKLDLPYAWLYNENYTHSVNFTNNNFQDNKNFGISILGQFAKIDVTSNRFTNNECKRGLIDISGMEKEISITNNFVSQNRGHFMFKFNINSHSRMFGVVPAEFQRNVVKENSFYSTQHNYEGLGYNPSSFAVGLFGIQQMNITRNLLSNQVLQYEFLAGVRSGSIKNGINVGHNWWGTADESEIRLKIFDFDDWNSYAIANFTPYLSSDSFDASTVEVHESDLSINLSKPLGGRIYKSVVLRRSDKPYIVKSDLTVMPGAKLVIDAGVEIQFYPSVGILVLGKLVAIGSRRSHIKMKPVVQTNHGLRYTRETGQNGPNVRLCVDSECKEHRRDGYLEVYNSTTMHWVPICDNRFTEWNAEVVCRQLGYPTTNVFVDSSKRNDLLYSSNKLNLVRYWPEPLRCDGDEAEFLDCQLRMNSFSIHDHRCFPESEYIYINCGELNIKSTEYWGGIRFSVPNFEQSQTNIRQQLSDKSDQSISVMEFVDVVGAGILHNYKTDAIQTALTAAHINHVSVSKSASHGISSIASANPILMYKNHVYDNLGVGLNILLLYGASSTDDNLTYPPIQKVNIPYHVFGMVDICDTNKELIVDGRVLLFYKYTNNPVDCVKIFSSKYGTKPLGFRLLHFNLFDATKWSLQQDSIRLYDGDIFNNTIPTIVDIPALKEHERETEDHEADHYKQFNPNSSQDAQYHKRFYRSTEGTLSIELHASGASGIYGFIAEVFTLDNSHTISHNLVHNFTKCIFENNQGGAVQYANAGEGIAAVAFHFNYFENNGKQLYGNFTTSYSAVRIKIQNTPDILIDSNTFKENQGGLMITTYGASWHSSLNGFITNNFFLRNKNKEALIIRGRRTDQNKKTVNIALNVFAFNYSPYKDTIALLHVDSNFTLNTVTNNTGRHNMDVHWFHSISSQSCFNNWFHNNKALMPKNRATIIASTSGQIFRKNYFVNPDNDFELAALNRSRYRQPYEREEPISATYNWWGYNETIAVVGRIKDQYDQEELLPVDYQNYYMNNKTVLSDHGKCGPGYTLIGKTCILYVGGNVRFEDAKTFCADNDGALPFTRGNEDILSKFVAVKQQHDYERYLEVWVESVDVPIGTCPILLDGTVYQNDCDDLKPFLCEKDPDLRISFASWYKDIMTIIALSVVGCGIILMVPCLIFWCCKSKQRHNEKLERRNSIRASVRSNRNALGFGEMGYKRRFDVHHQPPSQPTAFKISNSFANGSIDSIEKNPTRFDSSVEDNRSYDIYEAHNSQISFSKYDDKYSDKTEYEDKFRNDPQLEEENIKMAVNPTFDYAIPNKGFLDQSYSQPSHDSSPDWESTDSAFDAKQSIDFSQMLNGYNGYHDTATLPRNTPSAESSYSHDSKDQPLETAM